MQWKDVCSEKIKKLGKSGNFDEGRLKYACGQIDFQAFLYPCPTYFVPSKYINGVNLDNHWFTIWFVHYPILSTQRKKLYKHIVTLNNKDFIYVS